MTLLTKASEKRLCKIVSLEDLKKGIEMRNTPEAREKWQQDMIKKYGLQVRTKRSKNPFYDTFNSAIKVDPLKLADDPFYGHGQKVRFFVNGKPKKGVVNNGAGDGDLLVLGNDNKWYAGKDISFEPVV